MLIGFSKINSKLLILVIFPIFDPLRKIVDEKREDKFNDNNYFKCFRFYLSYILSIIFIIIIKCRTKHEKNNIFNKLKNINLAKKKEEKADEKADVTKSDKQNWINPQDKVKRDLQKEKMRKQILFIGLLLVILLTLNIFNLIFRDKYSGEDWNNVLLIGKQSIGVFFEIIFFIVLSMVIMNNTNNYLLFLLLLFFLFVLHFRQKIFKFIFKFSL